MEEQKELLEALLKDSKKRSSYARAAALCAAGILAVVLVTAALLIPKVLGIASQVEDVVASAETTITQISDMTVSITSTSTSLNTFITDNSQTLTDTVDSVSQIDVATLNGAIRDLKDAVEPFANLMNKFK